MLFTEKKAIEAARHAKGGGQNRGNGRNERNDYKRLEHQIKLLKKQHTKDKRKILSIMKGKDEGNRSGGSNSDESLAAGMQFGGRESVVRSKEKKEKKDKKKKAKKSS